MEQLQTLYFKIKNFPFLPKRIDKWIVDAINIFAGTNQEQIYFKTKLSRTRIKKLILSRNVWLDDQLILNPSYILKNETQIKINIPQPTQSIPKPEKIPISIIFEDEDLLVLDKQKGLVVHPAPGHETGTLVNGILYHCKNNLSGIGGIKRPGIVHRLDKDTSGLMIIAKSEIAHVNLVRMFQNHDLDRRYTALVWNTLPKFGEINKPIGRSRVNRKKMTVDENGKKAITKWKLIKTFFNTFCLIECKLETGRTHQIRVHMSHLGNNLIGDQLYGKNSPQKKYNNKILENKIHDAKLFDRQALHSSKISFVHPTKNKLMSFKSELPSDIKNLIKKLS